MSSRQLAALLLAAASALSGIVVSSPAQAGPTSSSCLNSCDATFSNCRKSKSTQLCYDDRNLCIDRCDAQRNSRETARERQQSIEDLTRRETPSANLMSQCAIRCEDSADACGQSNPGMSGCGEARRACLSRCDAKAAAASAKKKKPAAKPAS